MQRNENTIPNEEKNILGHLQNVLLWKAIMRIKIVLLYRWDIIFVHCSSLLSSCFVIIIVERISNTLCKFISLFPSLSLSHTQGLKSFQGEMWKAGYASGELVGHLYSDYVPMMNWCNTAIQTMLKYAYTVRVVSMHRSFYLVIRVWEI